MWLRATADGESLAQSKTSKDYSCLKPEGGNHQTAEPTIEKRVRKGSIFHGKWCTTIRSPDESYVTMVLRLRLSAREAETHVGSASEQAFDLVGNARGAGENMCSNCGYLLLPHWKSRLIEVADARCDRISELDPFLSSAAANSQRQPNGAPAAEQRLFSFNSWKDVVVRWSWHMSNPAAASLFQSATETVAGDLEQLNVTKKLSQTAPCGFLNTQMHG
jgi:hypothetical protein